MLFPNANRLDPAEARTFFTGQIKPRLPRSVAMPNAGEDTLLRMAFSDGTKDLLASNIQRSILLSF